jgi:hypothetical protein
MHGARTSHPYNFSLFFLGCGLGPPPSSTKVHEPRKEARPWLLLHSPCAHGNEVKRVRVKSTRRSNQVLKLTDYLSWIHLSFALLTLGLRHQLVGFVGESH